ncbi:MAG TPA: hypothetical protein PKY85_05415 [Nitrosomonas sp.]|nr:hypothetical protein [Nitrosomonas sp.]
MISIRKGLDLPISGQVDQALAEQAAPVRHVAVLGPDYIDLNPDMQVDEGDDVKCGQVLFTHKKLPDVQFTAPGADRITAIHRGAGFYPLSFNLPPQAIMLQKNTKRLLLTRRSSCPV